jgi:hypothetical protein
VEIIRSSILLQGSIIETFLEKHVSNLQIHEQFSNNQTIRCDTNMVHKKKCPLAQHLSSLLRDRSQSECQQRNEQNHNQEKKGKTRKADLVHNQKECSLSS